MEGVKSLREVTVRYSDQFADVVTEKLLTYAVGRGVEGPTVAGRRQRGRLGEAQVHEDVVEGVDAARQHHVGAAQHQLVDGHRDGGEARKRGQEALGGEVIVPPGDLPSSRAIRFSGSQIPTLPLREGLQIPPEHRGLPTQHNPRNMIPQSALDVSTCVASAAVGLHDRSDLNKPRCRSRRTIILIKSDPLLALLFLVDLAAFLYNVARINLSVRSRSGMISGN